VTRAHLRPVVARGPCLDSIPGCLVGWLEQPAHLELVLDLSLSLFVDELTDRQVQHPLTSSVLII
jgi:hypothetical protein